MAPSGGTIGQAGFDHRGFGGQRHFGGERGPGHFGGLGAAGVLGGLAAGALLGGALAPDPYDGTIAADGYQDDYQAGAADATAYCQQHFRSYDPASGTYLGYDGQRHRCP